MSTNTRTMSVSPASVWESLEDGFSYASWVVGTREIDDVDDAFPAPGSALHYRVGRWPLQHRGFTKVNSIDPGRRIDLEVRAWPAFTVRVTIEIVADGPDKARVCITEHPEGGIAGLLNNPAVNFGIKLRNIETLRRLERVAGLHGGHVASHAIAVAKQAQRPQSGRAPTRASR